MSSKSFTTNLPTSNCDIPVVEEESSLDVPLDSICLLLSPTIFDDQVRSLDLLLSLFGGGSWRTNDRCLESKFTHFSLELTFGGNNRVLVLERHCFGVDIIERSRQGREFPTLKVVGDSVSTITLRDVRDFWQLEKGKPYNFLYRNCKHLCYDFLARIVDDPSVVNDVDFFQFCKFQEEVYRHKITTAAGAALAEEPSVYQIT